jgi:hypothetical protein
MRKRSLGSGLSRGRTKEAKDEPLRYRGRGEGRRAKRVCARTIVKPTFPEATHESRLTKIAISLIGASGVG